MSSLLHAGGLLSQPSYPFLPHRILHRKNNPQPFSRGHFPLNLLSPQLSTPTVTPIYPCLHMQQPKQAPAKTPETPAQGDYHLLVLDMPAVLSQPRITL